MQLRRIAILPLAGAGFLLLLAGCQKNETPAAPAAPAESKAATAAPEAPKCDDCVAVT